MKYTVILPLLPLYKEPTTDSEYTDEAFYGQKVKVLEESGDFYKIHTEYDYIGYVLKSSISDEVYKVTHVVTSAFGDLLPEPKNGKGALIAVPRGSFIKVIGGGTERYAEVELADGRHGFIHKANIMPIADMDRKRTEAELRRDIVNTARLFVGTSYRWGGKTAAGIDCSGLAFMSYYMNGLHLYRDAHFEKSPILKEITLDEAKEGDLLFFPGHVAIYIGSGMYIHSTTSLGGVGFNSFREDSPLFNAYLKENLSQVASIF